MPFSRGTIYHFLTSFALILGAVASAAQSGNAGAIRGTVTDPSGAVIPTATVHLTNASSGVDRTVQSDPLGQFEFANVSFNNYQIGVAANGFASLHKSIEIRSAVGTSLKLVLQIATADSTVTVEATGDQIGRAHV